MKIDTIYDSLLEGAIDLRERKGDGFVSQGLVGVYEKGAFDTPEGRVSPHHPGR